MTAWRWSAPARVVLGLGALLGRAVFALGVRRRVTLENLQRAFPAWSEAERRAVARRTYENLGRGLAELLLLPGVSARDLPELVKIEGFEKYEAARRAGRGVVVAVSHFGNWEVLVRACGHRGIPLSVIVRRLRGRFNAWLLGGRRATGVRELADRGSTAGALAVLRANGVLAVAVDQNMLPRRGVFVDFFGLPACTTPAAAVFALRTGATVLAAFPERQPDGTHLVRLVGPIAVPEGEPAHTLALTQAITRAVEAAVRARPDHWYWLHRRWKTRPPGERLAAARPS